MSDNSPPEPTSFGSSADNRMDSDEFEYAETKVDDQSTKRRIGRDIYSDVSQAFEELFSNGVTGIHDAIERDFISLDEGKIEIELMVNESGTVCLRFRDNGIGMSEEIVRDVFLNFGITTGAQNENVVAKFGMGVASYPNLVGFNEGRIYMETNPRYTDEAILGYYSIDGLNYQKNEDNLRILGSEEYGTAYEMWLRDDISISEVNEWIKNVVEYNDVTVEVTNPNGSTETYTPSTVFDKFDTDRNPYVTYEDPEIGKFVAGTTVPDETVLIHRLIDYNLNATSTDDRPPFRSNIFIRLYTESQKICEGEHKGKIIVDDVKYEGMDEENKSKHIPRSEAPHPDDVAISPRVIGNREKLESGDRFRNWVAEKLIESYNEQVEELLGQIDTPEDFYNLDTFDQSMLHLAMSGKAFSTSYGYQNYGKKLRDEIKTSKADSILSRQTSDSFTITEEQAELFATLYDSSAIKNVNGCKESRGFAIEKERRRKDTTIYMGVSINDKKKRIVREDDPNCIIIKLDNASQYERYENAFGWEKLKKVKKSTIDEYDVSEETKKIFETDSDSINGDSSETLTVHYGRRQYNKKKVTANFVKESLENNNPDELPGTPMIAFPKSASRNVSSYYEFATKRSGIFKCRNKTWEMLQDYDEVKHINTILEEHKSFTEIASDGEVPVTDAIKDDKHIVLVTGTDELHYYLDVFDRHEICRRFKKVINDNKFGRTRYRPKDKSEVMVLSRKQLKNNHFLFDGITQQHVYYINSASMSGDYINLDTGFSNDNKTRILAHLYLAEWTDVDMYDDLIERITYFNNPEHILVNMRSALEDGYFKDNTPISEAKYNSSI